MNRNIDFLRSLLSVFFAIIYVQQIRYAFVDAQSDRITVAPSTHNSGTVVVSPYLHALTNLHAQRSIKRLLSGARNLFPSTSNFTSFNSALVKTKSTKTSTFNATSRDAAADNDDAHVIVKDSDDDRARSPATTDEKWRRKAKEDYGSGGDDARTVGGATQRFARIKRRKAEATKMDNVLDDNGATMIPLTELEIKSDLELQKSLYRTTMRSANYSLIESTTPISVVSPTTISPLFAGIYRGSQTVTLPPLVTIPAESMQFQSGKSSQNIVLPLIGANHTQVPSSEQFEQVGCGWDLLTQSCKDVFQFGWCNQCTDFGNVFLHDCKCTAVSALYANTLAAFASAAAAAGANATNGGGFGGGTLTPHAAQLPLPLADPFLVQQQNFQLQQQAQAQPIGSAFVQVQPAQPQTANAGQQQQQPILLVPVSVPIPLTQQEHKDQQRQGQAQPRPQPQQQQQPQHAHTILATNPFLILQQPATTDFSQAFAEAQRQALFNVLQAHAQQQQQIQTQQMQFATVQQTQPQFVIAPPAQAHVQAQPQAHTAFVVGAAAQGSQSSLGGTASAFTSSLQPYPQQQQLSSAAFQLVI